MSYAKERLLSLLRDKAYKAGDFVLSSGQHANYYIDGKQVTYDPEGAVLVGECIYELLSGREVDAIGGLTIGANPIASAASVMAHLRGRRLPAFIVRKEPKKHGLHRLIEGPLLPEMRVAIVDDVITSGASVLQAIESVEELGCEVVVVIALLDREQGGRQNIERLGYDFEAICTITELFGADRDQPTYAVGGRR